MTIIIARGIMGLGALLLFLFPWSSFSGGNDINIKINSWDGNNRYEGTINKNPIVIYLEDNLKKEKTINKHKDTEKETENTNEREYDTTKPKAGKIKIIFKDDKKSGTSLIYERDMDIGEIPEDDRAYIEKILNQIEKFHHDNRSYIDVKDKLNNIWQQVFKDRRR